MISVLVFLLLLIQIFNTVTIYISYLIQVLVYVLVPNINYSDLLNISLYVTCHRICLLKVTRYTKDHSNLLLQKVVYFKAIPF